MDVYNIVNRSNGTIISTQEMIFVLEQYIKEKKGVNVTISILSRKPKSSASYLAEHMKLNRAFNVALSYFLTNQ